MALLDIINLAADPTFGNRVKAQLVVSAVAIFNEAANDVQTISVTGTPTGGSFTLASLPGTSVINQNGTTTNASAAVTGLSSTVGLFVGMAVTGQGVPAGATVASVTSLTAITLSANATAGATVPLVFSGTPLASIPFNATAGDVQAILQAIPTIGNDDVLCTGGPLPGTPVVVQFCGILGKNPQRLMTVGTNSLTGGASPTPSVAHTTIGTVGQPDHARRAAKATAILQNPDGYKQQMVFGVAADATVQADYAGGVQSSVTDAHIAAAVSAMWNPYS